MNPQAIAAIVVVAAILSAAHVLTLGHRTAASPDETPSIAAGWAGAEIVARVVDAEGAVTVVRPPRGPEQYTRYMRPVAAGLALLPGDQVWTGSDGWVEIDFGNEVRVRVDPRTRVEIVAGVFPLSGGPVDQEKPTLKLYLGDVWASVVSLISRFTNFSIETPTAIAGVRGTLFRVSVDVLGKTTVSVNDGIVAVSTFEERGAEVLVASGQLTNVVAGQRPDPPVVMPAEAAEQWNSRIEWVKAHFERKEAYERRWALARTQVADEPQPSPAAGPDEGSAGGTQILVAAFEAAEGVPGPPPTPEQDSLEPAPRDLDTGEEDAGPETPPWHSGGMEFAARASFDAAKSGDSPAAVTLVTAAEAPSARDAADPERGAEEGEEERDKRKDADKAEDGEKSEAASGGETERGENGSDDRGHAGPSDEVSRRSDVKDDEELLAEELATAKEKIAERLVEAGNKLDRLLEELEEALNEELDALGERLTKLVQAGQGARVIESIFGHGRRDPGESGE